MKKWPENKPNDGLFPIVEDASSGQSDGPKTAFKTTTGPIAISSDALLAGHSEVQIHHRGEIYRLTLTRAGKLILHK
jgi:hemin uptake protein HemP